MYSMCIHVATVTVMPASLHLDYPKRLLVSQSSPSIAMSILDGHSCRMHNTNLKRQQVLLTLADPPSHSGRKEGREGKSEICPDINPMDWFLFSAFSLFINVVFQCHIEVFT